VRNSRVRGATQRGWSDDVTEPPTGLPEIFIPTKNRLRISRILGSLSADFPLWRQVRNRLLAYLLKEPGIRVGSHIRIDKSHPELHGGLELGVGVEIGAQAILDICGGVRIGDGVTLSQGALILSHDHTVDSSGIHWRDQRKVERPILIGNGAWIGARAVILGKARNIGDGAIVGAGSVVTKPVDPFTIVAGNPAQEIKRRVPS
jgi:acetyltransferase-like isoleucine patch superfamily enzyme